MLYAQNGFFIRVCFALVGKECQRTIVASIEKEQDKHGSAEISIASNSFSVQHLLVRFSEYHQENIQNIALAIANKKVFRVKFDIDAFRRRAKNSKNALDPYILGEVTKDAGSQVIESILGHLLPFEGLLQTRYQTIKADLRSTRSVAKNVSAIVKGMTPEEIVAGLSSDYLVSAAWELMDAYTRNNMLFFAASLRATRQQTRNAAGSMDSASLFVPRSNNVLVHYCLTQRNRFLHAQVPVLHAIVAYTKQREQPAQDDSFLVNFFRGLGAFIQEKPAGDQNDNF